MPKRYNTTKRFNRRRFKRAFRKGRMYRKYPKVQRNIMSSKMNTVHKWETSGTLVSGTTIGAIGSAYFTFQSNGMYRPDLVGSHQPMSFDQMQLLFTYFKVWKASIRVSVLSAGQQNTDSGEVYLLRSPVSSPVPTTGQAWAEQANCRWLTFGPQNSSAPIYLYDTVYIKKENGLRYLDSTFQGSDSANPAQGSFWLVGVSPKTTTATSVRIALVITFHATWSERRNVAVSVL